MTEETQKDATDLMQDFCDMGMSELMAKECAIKCERKIVEELELIDGIHMVGLKERIEIHRQTMEYISKI